ncbi:hypothetical protein JCM4814A_92580 [Streptomyces phaeofaciens JCM 4814]|uniref:Uncharacterized protein n=1 Tax=Streptomyces phaeofaciens TaxID=68254 RepID=A0A918HL54_9ACTN|nr:hypothetical protein GCM10010226_55920 [Streptomyces phaeofaciens]
MRCRIDFKYARGLELVTEAVRAVLEAMAHHAPEVLDEPVTAKWAERSGRPVPLCSQPSHCTCARV